MSNLESFMSFTESTRTLTLSNVYSTQAGVYSPVVTLEDSFGATKSYTFTIEIEYAGTSTEEEDTTEEQASSSP